MNVSKATDEARMSKVEISPNDEAGEYALFAKENFVI
jgi:hypothetical protein